MFAPSLTVLHRIFKEPRPLSVIRPAQQNNAGRFQTDCDSCRRQRRITLWDSDHTTKQMLLHYHSALANNTHANIRHARERNIE